MKLYTERTDEEIYAEYHRTAPLLDLEFYLDRLSVDTYEPGADELLAMHQLADRLRSSKPPRPTEALRLVWDAIDRFKTATSTWTRANDDDVFWRFVHKQSQPWRDGIPGAPTIPMESDEWQNEPRQSLTTSSKRVSRSRKASGSKNSTQPRSGSHSRTAA